MAQRAVISEYLTATNTNGFDFLVLFVPAFAPLPDYGVLPFYVLISLGILGAIGVLLLHRQFAIELAKQCDE